jgi:hypothetical protein
LNTFIESLRTREAGYRGQPRARALAEISTANPFATATIDLASASQAKMRYPRDLQRMDMGARACGHEVCGQPPAPWARAVTGEAHIATRIGATIFISMLKSPAQIFASLCKEASRNGITFSITASAACSGNR